MGWDASLAVVVDGHVVDVVSESWSYTHNCNRMVAAVLEEAGWNDLEKHWLIGHMGKSWFKALDGMSGEDGARLLKMIVFGLEREPERFKAMNPENGWGSYETLLPVLKSMLERSREFPSATWEVRG